MADLPCENPRKYGEFDDDFNADDINAALAGILPASRNRDGASGRVQPGDQVDADFLRDAGRERGKYGG